MIKRAVNWAHVGTLKKMGDWTLRSDLLMVFGYEKAINTDCWKWQNLPGSKIDLNVRTLWQLLLPLPLQNLFFYFILVIQGISCNKVCYWLVVTVNQEALLLKFHRIGMIRTRLSTQESTWLWGDNLFQSWHCNLLARWPWTSYSTFLNIIPSSV